jgi:WD40 repeat protein
MAYSPDGKMLAMSGNEQRILEVRDATSLEVVTRLHTEVMDRITSAAWSRGFIAAGYRTGELCMWNTGTWQPVRPIEPSTTFKPHTSYLTALDFSPDGALLASAGSEQIIQIWRVADLTNRSTDAERPTPLLTLKGHSWAAASIMFAPDGKGLVSASADKTVRLWSVPGNAEKNRVAVVDTPGLFFFWFSNDERRFIFGPHDHFLYEGETTAHGQPRQLGFLKLADQWASRGAISPDGRTVAVRRSGGFVELWDIELGKLTATLAPDRQAAGKKIDQLQFSPDGRYLIRGFEDGGIQVSRSDTNQASSIILEEHFPFVVSRDGAVLAAYAPKNDGVSIRALASGEPIGFIRMQTHNWETTAISPDKKWLAISSIVGNTIVLANIASGQLLSTPVREATGIGCIGFSPDGRTLVISTWDNAVSFWNVEASGGGISLEEIFRELDYFCAGGPPVTFSPQGRYLTLVGKAPPASQTPLIFWYAPSLAEIDATEQFRRPGNVRIGIGGQP